MNTLDNVHGHAVLELLAETPLSRVQLDAALTERFGAEVRFCTCSAQDMTREELLAMLIAKGKVAEVGGVLAVDPARICKHG